MMWITDRLLDWLYGLPRATHRVEVTRNLEVPMPDGVTLLGDRHRPLGKSGPQPVLLVRSPYGRTGLFEATFARAFARRGIQVFIQSTRGSFGSGGAFRPMTGEREDGLATLDWVRRQSWCDGRVAANGTSYLGHAIWAIAPYADPPLVAVGLNTTAARFANMVCFEGDVPATLNILGWANFLADQEKRSFLATVIRSFSAERRLARALETLPLRPADERVAGKPAPFWTDFVEHGPDDPFWEGRANHDNADLSSMPPVNMVTGWWDCFLPDQLEDFERLRAAGVTTRLLVGPGAHSDTRTDIQATASSLEWMRHHLLGEPIAEAPSVRIYVQQADVWMDLPHWPPPAPEQSFYLASGETLLDQPNRDPASSSRFCYDPSEPTPSLAGPVLFPPAGQADNAALEARSDVLVFTGPVLPQSIDVVGRPRAEIVVTSDTPFADLFVRVCDVDPKGKSRNVVDGILRLDGRIGETPTSVELPLYPTAYRFGAGHRIRVLIAGGAFPRFARNLGTGEAWGTGVEMQANTVRVLHDATHQSRVILPVLQPDVHG